MKSFPSPIFTFGGVTLLCLAILACALTSQTPAKTTSGLRVASAPASVPEPAVEYDYDPPVPGTYELPVLQDASNGTVLAPDGRPVELHDLLDGRVAVLSFIYTRCGDPRACLRASGVLSELQQASREDRSVTDRLQLLTLSFDPGYDTPEVMERYGRVFDRDEGGANWLFLTTRNDEELQPLLEAYGQRVDRRKRPSSLGPLQHTLRVYLIDSRQRVRNIYSYGLLDPRLVMADVRTMLMEESALARH